MHVGNPNYLLCVLILKEFLFALTLFQMQNLQNIPYLIQAKPWLLRFNEEKVGVQILPLLIL